MNLAEVSIKRPIAILMLVLGILLIGFVSATRIPFNLLPEITYPKITIRTEYPHAAPEEVENLVTKPIEQTVGIIQNVVKLSSVSRPGMSEVYVEFRWGVDMDVVVMDVREKLQLLEGFLPEDVKKPLILRYDPSTDPIMTIGVAGKLELGELRYLTEREIERELERIDGVAAVKVEGGYEDEIVIELDESKLAKFNLTPDTVIERLRRENINLAGGTLTEAGEQLSVRALNEFTNLQEIRDIVISSGASATSAGTAISPLSGIGSISGMSGFGGMMMGGLGALSGLSALMPSLAPSGAQVQVSAPIKLGDVATVRPRHKPREEIVRLNGKECIKVAIYKEGDANIVAVANNVNKTLERLKDNLRAEPLTKKEQFKLHSPVQLFKKVVNGLTYLFFNVKPFHLYTPESKLINELEVVTISDQSKFIKDSIFSVIQNALWGAIIAILVFYFFVRNMPSTWIMSLAIPTSIITTFNLMYFSGISFNIMSLAGIAVGVGNVVDNSIVVLENILRHRVKNPDLKDSAIRATQEVTGAIIASTITNCIVFFPIFYVEGMFRQAFGDLAWTVTFSMVASIFGALLLVPMFSVFFGDRVRLPPELIDADLEAEVKPEAPSDKAGLRIRAFPRKGDFKSQKNFFPWFIGYPVAVIWWLFGTGYNICVYFLSRIFHLVFRYPLAGFEVWWKWTKVRYPALIEYVIQRPQKFFLGSIALMIFSIIGLFLLNLELFPDVDQSEFRVHLRYPVGTALSENDRRSQIVEKEINALPEGSKISNVFSTIGGSVAGSALEQEKSENLTEILVGLTERGDRDFSDNELMEKVREVLKKQVNLEFRFSKPQLLTFKNPIEIEIVGYNLNDLRNGSRMAMSALKQIPGLADLESSFKESNPEIAIKIDRERAAHYGLSISQVAEILDKKMRGNVATYFRERDRQTDIMVEVSESQRANLKDLSNLSIPVSSGESVPLSALADIRPSQGPGNITRVSGSRVALITANLQKITLGRAVNEISAKLNQLEFPRGTYFRITGQSEEMRRSLSSLYWAMLLALFLTYIVLSAQFGSLLHPFVIMFGAFYSLVGLTIFFLVFRVSINIFSLIGILMMIGISVNDAIVMVSAINLYRERGMDIKPAIIQACQFRLRPNLITSLNTILGMVPMALPIGAGWELRVPMALAVISGLTASTFLTLTVVPAVYLVLDQAGEKVISSLRSR